MAAARLRPEGRRVRGWVRQGPWAGGGRAGIQSQLTGAQLTVGSRTFLKPPSGSSGSGSGSGLRSRCLRDEGSPSGVLRWGGGRPSWGAHGPTTAQTRPARPIPGFWAAVGRRRLRLLPLRAEVGFSGEGSWARPQAHPRPAGRHPSPRQGPSTPCRLCGAPWPPAAPALARRAPLLGEGQESAQCWTRGPWARPPGKPDAGQEDYLPETSLTSLGWAISALDPGDSGSPGRVLWGGAEVRE